MAGGYFDETSLPPNGPAGGALSGTYPNPDVRKVTSTAPAADLDVAINGGALKWRSGATTHTAEDQANKGAASGYPSLNASQQVQEPVLFVKSGADPAINVGAVAVNGGELKFGDAAAVQTVERIAHKGVASGYASLDGSSLLVQAAQLVKGSASGTGTAAIGQSGNDLTFGDGTTQHTVERVSRKNVASGYCGLDSGGKVAAAQITGIVPTGFTSMRKLSGGTGVNLPAATTTDVATLTRAAGEQLLSFMWIQENTASLNFGPGAASLGGAEGVDVFFERTTNANEFKVRAKNSNATTARTLDWAVFAMVP